MHISDWNGIHESIRLRYSKHWKYDRFDCLWVAAGDFVDVASTELRGHVYPIFVLQCSRYFKMLEQMVSLVPLPSTKLMVCNNKFRYIILDKVTAEIYYKLRSIALTYLSHEPITTTKFQVDNDEPTKYISMNHSPII